MGTTSSLNKVRISDDLVFRDSSLYYVPVGNQTHKSATAGGSAFSDVCVIVNLRATSTSRRTLFMRGFPDGIEVDSGTLVPTPDWQAAFNAWTTELIASSWAIKSRNNLVLPAQVTNAVQAFPSGIVTVTCAAAPGFVVGDGVTFSGVRGAGQLNGTFEVLSVAGSAFTVQLTVIMGTYTGAGSVIKISKILNAITSATAERVGDRKAGVPFDRRRGRRKVRTHK
jgi:hypothetical protein